MEDAGIDTSVFKAHSVRGATCSTAAVAGITTKDILDPADWSSEGTFQCFYCRKLGRKMELFLAEQFSSPTIAILQTLHVNMELSLPISNL